MMFFLSSKSTVVELTYKNIYIYIYIFFLQDFFLGVDQFIRNVVNNIL